MFNQFESWIILIERYDYLDSWNFRIKNIYSFKTRNILHFIGILQENIALLK